MPGFVERLIDSNTIAIGMEATSWEEAVRNGGALMTGAGLAEPRYIDAIVENHKTIGPYFVIAPGIAMPHAKPENGVLKTGYALVTLKQPVEFGDDENDPVNLLIFAGAINREEHNTEVVPEIAELCDSDEYIEELRGCSSRDEAVSVLQRFQKAVESGEIG